MTVQEYHDSKLPVKTQIVTDCGNCPFRYQDEYDEPFCTLNPIKSQMKDLLKFRQEGPETKWETIYTTPEWCDLRKETISIQLKENGPELEKLP